MIISKEKPPIWNQLEGRFKVRWESGVIVTYGDTVYTINGNMSPDIVVHEQVHIDQQTIIGAEEWWNKYLNDPQFRLQQELEAYSRQINYIVRHIPNRKKQMAIIEHIWKSISSVSYGNMISYKEAKEKLPIYG